jgi:hypothetical protein
VDIGAVAADLFVPGLNCTQGYGVGHKLFNTSATSTAADLRKTFKVSHIGLTLHEGEQYQNKHLPTLPTFLLFIKPLV